MNTHADAAVGSDTYPLALQDIAAWDPGTDSVFTPAVRASVPALQRGLVWTPSQLELLWDSILRGFPIGALVICRKIESQIRKSRDVADTNYHLLDGQQRCNAIALGFTDPFPCRGEEKHSKVPTKTASILWLDLRPVEDRNSTRNYLVRVTTPAHPWGYTRSDSDGRLSTGKIRSALEKIGLKPSDPGYHRPLPAALWPFDANVPVPLGWLLLAEAENEADFWANIARRAIETAQPWAEKVNEFLANASVAAVTQRSAVFNGIKRAHAARIIALVAPAELLDESQQEKADKGVEGQQEAISNIEHLFQRLNRQGTPLDDEELAYSMIKAYWPGLADPIDRIASRRMPEARMVSLGVQAALAREEGDRLPARRSVSELRAIARKDGRRKEKIHHFIENELGEDCALVDRWLLYDPQQNSTGLLPVHVTGMALRSREVYLLLLCFAARVRATLPAADHDGWRVSMQAVATILRWFAGDSAKAANAIYKYCQSELSVPNLRAGLAEATKAQHLHRLHSPRAVKTFLRLPDSLEGWYLWKLIDVGDGVEENTNRRERDWWRMLGFRENREMLLYAQRHYLHTRFPGYDPARRDLWAEHNRPWDYDHLLASNYLYNKRTGKYRSVAQQFLNTIGNLRAWPFEKTVRTNGIAPRGKIGDDDKRLQESYLLKNELDAFSGGDQVRLDKDGARAFMEACRTRMLRIYGEWYTSMDIAHLLGAEDA